MTVKFGKPMDFSRFDGLEGNRFIERAVVDEVMYELMRLSGQEYVDLYPSDSVPLPVNWRPDEWMQHPALTHKRHQQALDEPFDEATVRSAVATYYGMVTFLTIRCDAQ